MGLIGFSGEVAHFVHLFFFFSSNAFNSSAQELFRVSLRRCQPSCS
ncbi:hypothetical protein LCGC14_1748660, partial [marine sediment metagenome]